MSLEKDGNAYGVFFLNSNAMGKDLLTSQIWISVLDLYSRVTLST